MKSTVKNGSLLIVGNGCMHAEVELAAESHEKIRYAGRLNGDELLKTYYTADAVVLPSHFEPWGLVVNEAMAAGCPVIVSDKVGCVDDLVEHEKTGMVIKMDKKKDLESAIHFILNHPDICDRMGQRAEEKIAFWTLKNEAINICNAWKRINSFGTHSKNKLRI